MMKRILSLLLCLIMVLSFVPQTAQAGSVDDIYVDEGSSLTEVTGDAVQPDAPIPTEPTQSEEMDLPEGPSPVVVPSETDKVVCDCGTDVEELARHSDGCALKQFCIELCAKSAMDIYSVWYSIGAAERAFIKEYLAQHDPDTLTTFQKICSNDQIMDESADLELAGPTMDPLTGNASAQVGDVTVDAFGIPEGSSLSVEKPSKKITNKVEKAAADLGQNPEQLFLYDISVQNDESNDWQPKGDSVYMTLTIPGVKLHKYATVYVVHVDDDGNTSTIPATVKEDGSIAFQTDGFSTFAGFTVDFKYGDAFFSIDGLTNIKLSELFDELKMPLYAADVAELTFSDETLVSVTRLEEENDFLLTSLKAFKTQETLTVTMNDGNTFVINVTDATAFIYVGGGSYGKGTRYDTDGNQICSWYADKDGDLSTQITSGKMNDGWSTTNTVYVGGSGNFRIGILPYSNVKSDVARAYIRLNQIRVCGSVTLTVDLTDDFDSTEVTEVRLQAASTSNMFIIEDGASLILMGRAPIKDSSGTQTKAACYLILDGWSEELNKDNSHITTNWGMNDYTLDNQLVLLTDGARGLTCNYVRFQDAHRSAIRICNGETAGSDNRLKTFQLNNCIFDGDVCRENTANNPPTGSGGAIYLEGTGKKMDGVVHYTWMDEFKLSHCAFNGCWAAESGGAIGLYGRVKDIEINYCSFTKTYAKKGFGGAIVMAGHASTMKLTGSTFDGCSSTAAGGAVYICSRVMWSENNTYSRLNELTVTNCTFKNSNGIANSKAANSPLGGGLCLDSSINKISITGTKFNGLKAEDGAGVSFGYVNMNAKNSAGETVFMSNDSFTTEQNALKSWRPTTNEDGSLTWQWRSTLGDISMSNCDFTNTYASNQGGGIHFRTHSSARQVIMDDVNFDGCHAVGDGSAIMLGDTIIPDFQYRNSFIQKCKTSADHSNYSGGTFRTLGNTTCVASIDNVTFKNNLSHCSGGGIYWNASGVRQLWEGRDINTAMSVSNCTFDGNTAGWYGGGIYCEAVMTVTACELKNNIAVLIGGGIALQLYNNSVRPFADGGVTNLTLDSSTNIHHNYSKVGGGLSIRANATQAIPNNQPYGHTLQFTLGGAQIHHNYARTNGGGVWFNVESYDVTDTEKDGLGNQQEVERFNKLINLDSGSVYSNIAGGNGGGIYMNGGDLYDPEDTTTGQLTSNGTVTISLSGAAIYDNEAGRTATGVTVSADDVLPPTVSRVTGSDGNIKFTKSTVSNTGGNGGGIYLYGAKGLCNITGGVIGALKNSDGTPGTASKNIANRNADASAGGNGGGIAIYGEGRIVMDGGYIVNNTADTAGGGLAVHGESSMYLTNGFIKYNISSMGGGVSLHNAKAFKPSSNLEQDQYGLFLNGGSISENMVIPDTTRSNIAYGGGICISGTSTAKISDGVISLNRTSSDTAATPTFASNQEGGGVAVCEHSTLDIAGGTISDNKAYSGGGIAIRGASTLRMDGELTIKDGAVQESSASGVIKNNYAYQDGGAAYLGPYDKVTNHVNRFYMTNGWIYNNEADNGWGGAVYVTTFNGFYLEGGYIEDNHSSGYGGAIYATNAVIDIDNGVIQDNYTEVANAHGGAIYAYNTTVTVNNGLIQNNICEQGSGGAIYTNSCKLKISNGVIQNNICKAGSGGGIYITYGELTLSGNASKYGSLLNNRAPKGCGGGIAGKYVQKVDIDYLHAEGNSGKYGGGIYLEYCADTTIDGGVFTKNYSNQGAGLFIRSGKSTITGGQFTWNVSGPPATMTDGTKLYVEDSSAQHGGGIVVDDLTTTVGDSWVKILGGEISHNTAPNGGGIWLRNISGNKVGCCPTAIMEGGVISYNTATKYGGGVFVDGNGYANGENDTTRFTIKGGDISYNTANGYGGGVYATGKGDVHILENTETGTHGTISHNQAHCGGGIGVAYGATLTVNNGYITYNKAYVPENPSQTPAKTGYHQLSKLYGAGGGIFLVTGTKDATSTFTLEGDSMAVYGNEAGFCADDVFSNGEYTKLDMPLVSEMDLAGYGFKPEGWVEDFNPVDANYGITEALDMFDKNGAPEELSIQRYRSANGAQRRYALITADANGNNYVRGNEDIEGADVASYNYVNKADAYIAMTLGIPAAVDDTVVIDFSHNVNINLIENDLFMDEADFANYGELGVKLPTGINLKDGIYYSDGKNGADHKGTFSGDKLYSSSLKYGNGSLGDNGIMTYARGTNKSTMIFDGPETFAYTVKHGDSWFYANVAVIPATTLYFEDNISQIKYHETSANETLAQWTKPASNSNIAQNQDRPGPALIEGLDADSIYGYDSHYASNTTYSNNGIRKVTTTRHRIVDVNADNICDACDKVVGHTWTDADKNKKCDVCGITGHHCKDTNTDHKCDTCKAAMNHSLDVFKDSDKDGICDDCHGTKAHSCIDKKDKNGYCDLCGIKYGTHTTAGRATFTFKGTGFDIISLCNKSTGIVMVSVYAGEVTDFDNPPMTIDRYVASYMVDTHYGYVYDEQTKKWEYNENASTTLYQVPVIKADLTKVMTVMDDHNTPNVDESQYKDWGYGTYSVEIYTAPSFLEREAGYWSSDFYLDAIRVYNPAGTPGTEHQIVKDAYKADGEAWPEYFELRNMFINQKDLGVTSTTGVIFIDGMTNPALDDYKSWGPNNEVYLNPNQSIAFTVDASTFGQNVAAVHVGMKGLTAKGSVTVKAKGEGDASYKQVLKQTLSTADLYYDISAKDSKGNLTIGDKVVMITNTGATPISITNIKVGHYNEPKVKFRNAIRVNQRTAEIALEILGAEELVDPIVTPKRPALSFDGMVCYNVFFSAENLGDLTAADLGLAVFSTEDTEGTIETAREVIMGATEIDGLYMVTTSGVHAKSLGDKQYFRAFAKKADGTFVYSRMVSYSAVDYAKNVLAKSDDVTLKRLVVAMLNYGAEAQKFFGYKTDDLMTKDLTADDLALLNGMDASVLEGADKVDASKVGAFASTGGFTRKSPAISFKGAFEINYFFTPANAVDGNMTLYFWNEDTYKSVTELTAENADKAVVMTLENGTYTASSDEIAAKYLDRTVYVAAVYESNGETYCSGVLPYSISAYCQNPPATVQDLATAAAIYGWSAKQYFGA